MVTLNWLDNYLRSSETNSVDTRTKTRNVIDYY